MTVHEYPRSHGSLSGLSDTDHHVQYALDSQDVFANRPLPGRRGRLFFATDQNVYYRDTGTTWTSFGLASGTTITSTAPGELPLTVRGIAGQTNDVFAAISGSGRFAVTRDGAVFIAPKTGGSQSLLLLRAATGETNSLASFQNNGGTEVARMFTDGSVFFSSDNTATPPIEGRAKGLVSTAGSTAFGSAFLHPILNSSSVISNTVALRTRARRLVAGDDWSTAVLDIYRQTDATEQQRISFLGTPGNIEYVTAGPAHVFYNATGTVTAMFDHGIEVMRQGTYQGRSDIGLTIGNDSRFVDRNIANALALVGTGDPAAASLYLGVTRAADGFTINGGTSYVWGNAVNGHVGLTANSARTGNVYLDGRTFAQSDDNDGAPQVNLWNGVSAAAGTKQSAFLRWLGIGAKHCDVTWHPGENYLRFRTTAGSLFDGNASLVAASYVTASTAESKENVKTLDVTGVPVAAKGRGASKAMSKALAQRVKDLRPVEYKMRGDKRDNAPVMRSFVAEEAAKVVPEIVAFDGNGKPTGIDTTAISTVTLALVQHLMDRIEALEAR